MTKEEVIKEYRVREILEAARRVMARYGMQGTTVDRVAEEAKVAKGTIYLYFDTKDELVHAAVLEGMREMVAETVASDDPAVGANPQAYPGPVPNSGFEPGLSEDTHHRQFAGYRTRIEAGPRIHA